MGTYAARHFGTGAVELREGRLAVRSVPVCIAAPGFVGQEALFRYVVGWDASGVGSDVNYVEFDYAAFLRGLYDAGLLTQVPRRDAAMMPPPTVPPLSRGVRLSALRVVEDITLAFLRQHAAFALSDLRSALEAPRLPEQFWMAAAAEFNV